MLENTPFKLHVLVCQNKRSGDTGRLSCGGDISSSISQELKDFVDEHHLKSLVRITSTNCLGPCAKGPNVMIYPQEVMYSKCSVETIGDIKSFILENTA